MNLRSILQFIKRRRWALFFLNLTAGLFAAPFLYWNSILMRVVLRAAQDEPVLPWLNAVNALGGLLLLMLAAFGAGGCLSALRKMLRGEDGFIPREVFSGMVRCAKNSIFAGLIFGLALGAARIGLLNLHMITPPGFLRAFASAFLFLQPVLALPLCLLSLTLEDAFQRRPLRAVGEAGRLFAQRPLQSLGAAWLTAAPLALFFVWQKPQLTIAGFFLVALCGLVPAMLAWQPGIIYRKRGPSSVCAARAILPFALLIFFAIDAFILALTPVTTDPPEAALGKALDFVWRMYADSGTLLRDLLAASSVWPILLSALLGSACCIMAAYACACYKFRARGLVFSAAVLLQILPIMASYASLEQLLRKLELPVTGALLGLAWGMAYLLVALLLLRRFTQMLPGLQKHREKFPGVRLFFYYALPRAPLLAFSLMALATLGCWDDALAPFWYMRSLGAFSLAGTLRERMDTPWAYILAFLAVLALALFTMKLTARLRSRLPRPSAG